MHRSSQVILGIPIHNIIKLTQMNILHFCGTILPLHNSMSKTIILSSDPKRPHHFTTIYSTLLPHVSLWYKHHIIYITANKLPVNLSDTSIYNF